ncbi:MAG TPA: glycosyltransferase family 4 protein, partial [Cytophagales bacterium]|nr:glycosyltransferase family 4 protein [Cytophagales bacterium]
MSKRVRILHFVEQVNQYDFVDTLIRHMQSASLEAMLCVLHEHPNFITTDYRNIGIKFFNLDLYGRKSYLKVIARILTIIKEENIEILHCHLYDMAFLGAAIKWLNPSIKLVTSRHYSDDLYLTSKRWKLKRALWIEKFSNNKADAIISPSQVITDLLIRQGVKPCKINRIDYCFDFSADKYIPSVDNDEYLSIRKRLLRQPNDCFLIGNFARH